MNKKNTFRAIQKVAGVAVITAAIGFLGVSCGGSGGGEDTPQAPALLTHAFVGYQAQGEVYRLEVKGTGETPVKGDAATVVVIDGSSGDVNMTLTGTVTDYDKDYKEMTLSLENETVGTIEANVAFSGKNLSSFSYPGNNVGLNTNTFSVVPTNNATGKTTSVQLDFFYPVHYLQAGDIAHEATEGVVIEETANWTTDWVLAISDVEQDGELTVTIDAAGIQTTPAKATITEGTGPTEPAKTYTVKDNGAEGKAVEITITFDGFIATDKSLIEFTPDTVITSYDLNGTRRNSVWVLSNLGITYDKDQNTQDVDTEVTIGVQGLTVQDGGNNKVTLKPETQTGGQDIPFNAAATGKGENTVITITFDDAVAGLAESEIVFDPSTAVASGYKLEASQDEKVWTLSELVITYDADGDYVKATTVKVDVNKTGVASSPVDVELVPNSYSVAVDTTNAENITITFDEPIATLEEGAITLAFDPADVTNDATVFDLTKVDDKTWTLGNLDLTGANASTVTEADVKVVISGYATTEDTATITLP